ncbi:MAG TPA: hypothetical protein VMZ53_13810 [Kofleriaceae bacterium]|nr:hypothetical protein [Kofleriaceae bacterium]
MRTALLLVCASGCIISPPEGATQSWPPSLVTVQAVTSGDLDGNGSTDIVVYGTGGENRAGLYLLTGGQDLGGGQSKPVRSFSTFVPAELAIPTAALQLGGAAPSIYVATAEDGPGDLSNGNIEITQYSNILGEKARETTAVPAGNATLWLHAINFPGAMLHIAVSNGGTINHASANLGDVKPIPAASGPTWDLAQLATSYPSGMDQIAVVATPMQIQRASVPGPSGGMFAWTVVRNGPAWVGQTSIDLDGDGREEILGLDLANKQVCVVDPGASTVPVTPVCLAIPMLPGASEVTLLAGANITMTPGPDILIVQASGSDTQFTLVEDYTYTPGTLISTTIHPLQLAGPAHGRTVIANSGPGTPNSVLVFGTDGAVGCVLGPC